MKTLIAATESPDPDQPARSVTLTPWSIPGGVLATAVTTVVNTTGKAEPVLTAAQIREAGR